MGVLGRLLRGLGISRRRADRIERDQRVQLFAGVAPLGPGRLVDLSTTGAQVELLAAFDPQGVTRVLIMQSSQLLQVEPVWVRESRIGMRVHGSTHIRGYTDGDADAIKSWWSRHRMDEPDAAG